MLSREEVELYRRDGYLPGRRLLSAAEAERLRDDCLRTCMEPLVLGATPVAIATAAIPP